MPRQVPVEEVVGDLLDGSALLTLIEATSGRSWARKASLALIGIGVVALVAVATLVIERVHRAARTEGGADARAGGPLALREGEVNGAPRRVVGLRHRRVERAPVVVEAPPELMELGGGGSETQLRALDDGGEIGRLNGALLVRSAVAPVRHAR